MDASLDPAFRTHASGLIVPEEVSRKREVWTPEETRLLDRTVQMLKRKKMQWAVGCETCQGDAKLMTYTRSIDGNRVARCGCTDRILTKAFRVG